MSRGRTVNATDCGVNLDHFPAQVRRITDWVYLQGCEPWDMASHAAAFLGLGPCPICKGLPLKKSRYCLGCDRTGLDGKVEFAGLDIDSCPDPDYPTTGTIYDPEQGLAGGVEPKPAKIRRGVARSRKAG